jgi:tripartite-type tricarboxylate transporter receptor subunit TctC
MKLPRRKFLHLAAGAAYLPALSRMAGAQAYPTRPIKLIVAFPAGGPADTMGRMVGQAVSAKIGQPVVVENVGGAGGTIALRMMTNASPDGYTLLVNSGGPFCTASLLYKLDYDPLKALVPVGNFAADSAVLVTTRTLPIATLSEFIQYAKANPGKLNSGAAIGTNQHLMAEAFKAAAGVDIPHIPYRGGAPAIADLIGGQIHMLINNKSVLLQLALEGRVRPLAVTSTTRWSELPSVPTLAESGIVGVPTDIWYAIFAPANTPSSVVNRLNTAINDGMRSPDLRSTVEKLGIDLKLGSSADAAAAVTTDCPRWIESAKLVKIE